MKRAKTADEFFAQDLHHREHLDVLRTVLLETELKEEIKWGMPVYTLNGKNVVGLGSFKAYAGLWFYQGTFLEDPAKVLINAQEGKTRGMRQWRFVGTDKVDSSLVRKYVSEAIENQKLGKEIKVERKELVIPDILQRELDSHKTLRSIFEAMSLSHKREYAEHIAEAKREDTRKRRLEKVKAMILDGTSLNDKYRK